MSDRTSQGHRSRRRRRRPSRRRMVETTALVLGIPLLFLLLLLSVELIEYQPESAGLAERPAPGFSAERAVPPSAPASRLDSAAPVPSPTGGG